LEPDNKAGLKSKHQFRLLIVDCAKLQEDRKWEEAKAAVEKALALPGVSGEQKQDAYMNEGEICYMQQDLVGVVACLNKAVDAAPDKPQVARLKSMVQRFKPIAEAQESIPKLKAGLAKAQGLDRAKLLDQLIEAYAKMAVVGKAAPPQDLEKWSREIMALDPDNKAGMKRKYEFRVLIAEARKLLIAKKGAEAETVIDKALALHDLTGEQTQEGKVLLGTYYFRTNEYQKAVDCLKTGLAAAPESERAPMIQYMLQQAESALAKQKAHEEAGKPKAEKETGKPKAN